MRIKGVTFEWYSLRKVSNRKSIVLPTTDIVSNIILNSTVRGKVLRVKYQTNTKSYILDIDLRFMTDDPNGRFNYNCNNFSQPITLFLFSFHNLIVKQSLVMNDQKPHTLKVVKKTDSVPHCRCRLCVRQTHSRGEDK